MLAITATLAGCMFPMAVTIASAQADDGTAPVVCPPGSAVTVYCSDVQTGSAASPVNTVAATTATSSGRTVLPEEAPAAYRWELWGTKLNVVTGPALKFKLQSGLNGAPGLKSVRLVLPAGLTFAMPSTLDARVSFGRKLLNTARSMTVDLRDARPELSIYIKNHSMIESANLREALALGTIKTLNFKLIVTDAAGRATDLTFAVTPQA